MNILIYGDKATDLVKPYDNLISEGLKPIFNDEISELDFYQEKSGMIKSVRLYDVYIRFEFGDDYDKILMGDYCYTDNYSSIQNLKELAHRQGKPYSPVNTIGISMSGSYPDSFIKLTAKSYIFTGSPMSNTNISPPFA